MHNEIQINIPDYMKPLDDTLQGSQLVAIVQNDTYSQTQLHPNHVKQEVLTGLGFLVLIGSTAVYRILRDKYE